MVTEFTMEPPNFLISTSAGCARPGVLPDRVCSVEVPAEGALALDSRSIGKAASTSAS